MSTPNFLEAHRRGLPIVMPSACACGSHADGHGHAPSASPATDAATTRGVAGRGTTDAAAQAPGGSGPAGVPAPADAHRDPSAAA